MCFEFTGDTNGVLALPHEITSAVETSDWSYVLIPHDVRSEFWRLMLLQLLAERENTASETEREH